MMLNRPLRVAVLHAASGGLLAVVLAACAPTSPEEMIASARRHIEQHDYRTAIIELKNALQANPNNGEARLILGEVYLTTRDPVSAEKELQRALELKQPDEKTFPLFVRALLDQGKYPAVISEVSKRSLFNPPAVALTQTALGHAYLRTGDKAHAEQAFDAALAAVPGYPRARLGKAILSGIAGKLDEAMKETDEVIAADSKSAEAYAFRAELFLSKGQRPEAKKALEQALTADGDFLAARFALISMLLDDGAYDEAAAQTEQTRKVAPRDLRLNYFDGLIAFRKADFPKARDQVLQVLKSLPDHVPSLVLAGATELQLGEFVAAEDHLRRAVARAPGSVVARRMLVAMQLRAGRPAQALETLRPLVDRGMPQDPQLQLLAGETFLANGELKKAAGFFASADTKDDMQLAMAKTRLGQVALATGSTEQGLKDLEAASGLDAGQYQSDLALIIWHLKRQEFDKAIAAAQALEKKQPKNPLTYYLYGVVYLAKQDVASARKSFERALELQPTYLPAANNLGVLDILDKRPEAARKRYEEIIAKDPKNDEAYLALANVQSTTGMDAQTIGATIQRAVNANPQSVRARLALVNFHLRNNDGNSALTAAQQAAAAIPGDAGIVEALGIAQEAAGSINQAVETYTRLATLQPQSPIPLYRLASLYVRQKQTDKAVETLRRVQKMAPSAHEVVQQLAQVYLAANRAEDALKEARGLQRKEPNFAGGYSLEGAILFAQGKFGEAEKAYRAALKIEPKSGGLATRLYEILLVAHKPAEADALVKKWFADNPKDGMMRLYLAERDMRTKNWRSASVHYQALVDLEPDNPALLNNLAWTLGELNDPKALDYAERAIKLAPNNAVTMDTLGVLLVKRGEPKKGLEYLERATALAPKRNDIRLHYAKALIKAGQKDAARKELETLKVVTDNFDGKDEVAALFKGL